MVNSFVSSVNVMFLYATLSILVAISTGSHNNVPEFSKSISLFPVQSTIVPNTSIIQEPTNMIRNENEPQNYLCPPECDCWLHEGPSRHLNIFCTLQHIHDVTYFDVFNSTTITCTLTLRCDTLTHLNSTLYPFMFRGLHSFTALTILNCPFDYVPEKTFYGMTALRELYLSNAANLTFHAAAFDNLPFLENLSIVESEISSAPSLCHLRTLRLVNFTGNNIGTLGETGLLCNAPFQNLQVITLCKNNIRKIAINISEISNNLLYFAASDNKIDHISMYSFKGLYSLSLLKIENNLITSLSSNIFQNVNALENLSLAKNRMSNFSPGLLSHLGNLTVLHLSDLSLNSSIFYEIRKLLNLQQLVLRSNCIKKMEMSFLSFFSKLEYLDISHNYIRNLNENIFASLHNLEKLNISGNLIEIIDKDTFSGLSKVDTLNLQHNRIRNLHRDCFQPLLALRVLNLCCNAIENLPSFQGLQNLLFLNLRHNIIKYLDFSTFAGANGIEVINLNNNKIKTIWANTFINLQNLLLLSLNNNEIDYVDYNAFGTSPITQLFLRKNNISDIIFLHYSSFLRLRTLDLSYNNVRLRISSDTFGKFRRIEHLVISNNKIEGVSSRAFKSLLNLRLLDLSHNEIRYLEETALSSSSPIGTLVKLQGNPFHCDCSMQWIKIWWSSQNTNGVFILDLHKLTCTAFDETNDSFIFRLPTEDFLCQYERDCNILKCSCCDVDACSCSYPCPDKCMCLHSSDRSVNAVRCQGKWLDVIPEEIPPAATHVYLDGNNFSVVSRHSLSSMPHLEYLYMNDSNIHTIDDYAFATLSSLKTLHLKGNYISTILSKTFFGLNKLQRLSLSSNRISFIDVGSFSHLPATYKLDLSKNLLHKLDKNVLYEMSFASSVHLSDNPWTCDCEFLNYFSNSTYFSVQIIKDFSALTCTTTTTSSSNTTMLVSNALFSDMCPSIIESQTKELLNSFTLVSTLATLLGALVIVVIIIFILFWKRDFLKVCIYFNFCWRICNHDVDPVNV